MTDQGGATSYLSAQEIADLRLAGLPTSKAGVIKRAAQENWPFVAREARGGGRAYSVLRLPAEARSDFLARTGNALDAAKRPRGRPAGFDFFSLNPDVVDAVDAILASQRTSARNVEKLLKGLGLPVPASRRTLEVFIAKLERDREVLYTATRDPDRFKSSYRMALGRMDATVSYAHEVWEIDTTKADVMCKDGRKAILGIIDRWSRRARYQVVESESAQSVRRILIDTIRAWGVMPARLKVDNGSGFINASVGSALDLLDIELDPCLPGHPEDKPFVERLFGTFNRERASLLKGFIGHNVADAQKLRAKAKKETGRAIVVPHITSIELQAIVDAWIDGEYHQRTHSTLQCSPMEKWQSSPQPARRAPSEDALKIALSAYVGPKSVTKRGIRWKNGRYWSPALVAHMGKEVMVRRDEDDLGALFIFDADGRYVDTAVNFERSGMSEQQFALAARRQMNAHMANAKAELRDKQRKFSIDKARDALLREEAERAGKIAHLPMPTRAASTPTIESIRNAPQPQMPTQAQLDDAMVRSAPVPRTERTIEQKVAEADAVIAAATRGERVEADALRRARLYAQSSEYKAEKMIAGHFGAPAAPTHHRRSGAA
ncbi:Mu transposase C-terminal domain-containing protein [Sphingobium aquiterrae]|uniref:Mu transposase C-terminal domain-containing protein n=1 Tax=Sphingobium aquiterrae TaxID=2038656 RepID=UPI00301B11C4